MMAVAVQYVLGDNGFPDVITMHVTTLHPSIQVDWMWMLSVRDDGFSVQM